MSNNSIVLSIVVAYMLVILLIGFFVNRWNKNSDAYMVAGRSLGAVIVGAVLASEFVGLGGAVGTAESAFTNGLGAALNLVTASVGFIIFAFFIAPKYREKRTDTISSIIGDEYGSTNRLLTSGLLMFSMVLVSVGLYVGAASTLAPILDIPRLSAVAIVGVVGLIHVSIGGMLAVSWTNALDVVLVISGILVAGIVGINYVGGLQELRASLPSEMFSLTSVGWPQIIAWLAANVGAIIATQYVIQALASSSSPRTAKQSSLLAGLILIPVAFGAALVGMSAAVAAPDINPSEAYGWLASQTNPLLGGLMVVGVGAAMMGTLSAVTHAATALALRDFYVGIFRPDATDDQRLRFARISNAVFSVFPISLALLTPTLLSLLFFGRGLRGTLGVLVVCALFLPNLLGPKAVAASISSALILSTLWYLLGDPLGVDNVFIAMGIPVLVVAGTWLKKRLVKSS